MLDFFLKSFLETAEPKKAEECMSACLKNGYSAIAKELGEFFLTIYPTQPEILFQTAISYVRLEDYEKAYEHCQKILTLSLLSSEFKKKVEVVINACIPNMKDKYTFYSKQVVDNIAQRKQRDFPLVTLTITTCKRYELFEKTMNSFLNTCLDLDKIDHWLCVDDNSSEEDRTKMKERYPFFEFYFKKPEEKGHPQSMNIIKHKVKTPFMFHMEDDWCFFARRNYITECIDILNQDEKIGQCLINRNYGETHEHRAMIGGFERTSFSGLKYFIHEYCHTKEEQDKFYDKYGHGPNCAYWPHFSFRPSLMKTRILEELGDFNTIVSHFERKYADEYYKRGYYSVFFPSIYCMHTGRLTAEIDDETKLNAYKLNGEKQFTGKEEAVNAQTPIIKMVCVNLDRRQDRWNAFTSQKQVKNLSIERFSAIDGGALVPTEQLQRIFDGNDYNMRVGLVGCAMSHLYLYTRLVNDEQCSGYLILEDDAELTDNFIEKLKVACNLLKPDYDILFLGHHLWEKFRTPEAYSRTENPIVEKWDADTSLRLSIGGTAGYLISKKGAKKFLDFVNTRGMTNGIDTMLQKSADTLSIYYCHPHLVFSDCYTVNKTCDTDIQHNFNSLTIPTIERYKKDVDYFSKFGTVLTTREFEIAKEYCVTPSESYVCVIYQGDRVKELLSLCTYPCYPISYDYLVIVQKPTEENLRDRYFDRLIRNGEYSVKDAIQKVVRTFVPFSDVYHVFEGFTHAIPGYKPTYAFDTIDEGGLENLIKLTCEMLDQDDLDKYVESLVDVGENSIRVLQHNNKSVLRNKKYGISFPREEVEDLEEIYKRRFSALKNVLLAKDPITLVCCTHWPDVSGTLITDFLSLLLKYNKDVKMVLINCTSDPISHPNITHVSVEFPEKFKGQEWTPEKIHYDQAIFKPAVVQVIKKFYSL